MIKITTSTQNDKHFWIIRDQRIKYMKYLLSIYKIIKFKQSYTEFINEQNIYKGLVNLTLVEKYFVNNNS